MQNIVVGGAGGGGRPIVKSTKARKRISRKASAGTTINDAVKATLAALEELNNFIGQ